MTKSKTILVICVAMPFHKVKSWKHTFWVFTWQAKDFHATNAPLLAVQNKFWTAMLNLSTRILRILYALSAPEPLANGLALSTMSNECIQRWRIKCAIFVTLPSSAIEKLNDIWNLSMDCRQINLLQLCNPCYHVHLPWSWSRGWKRTVFGWLHEHWIDIVWPFYAAHQTIDHMQ